MNMNTKIFFSTLIALIMVGGFYLSTSASSADAAESDDEISVISVYMYADWCGSCQAIKPKMEEATRAFEGEPVLFTKMDMTDDFTAHQSKLMAYRLGLQELFDENQGRTGFVMLVDANTLEVLDRITAADETEEIKQKISALLSR